MKRAMVAASAAMTLMPATVTAQDETPDTTTAAPPVATATAAPEAVVPRIHWMSAGIDLVPTISGCAWDTAS